MFFKRLIKNKKIFVLVLIIVIAVIVFLGTKVYLYANFLIGNDIVIKLDANKEYVYLTHGSEDFVEFETKIRTNPFCSAVCESSFKNVNSGVVLDQSMFSIKPGNSHKQIYKIKAMEKGIGKEVYDYDLECKSSGGFLCHSDFENSNRNVLITVEHDFNDEEKNLKKVFEENSLLLAGRIGLIEAEISSLKSAVDELNATAIIEINFSHEEVETFREDLDSISSQEGYFYHLDELNDLTESFEKFENGFFDFEKSVTGNVSVYNQMIDSLVFVRVFFENLNYSTEEELGMIRNFSEEYNLVVDTFLMRNKLEVKENLVNNLVAQTDGFSSSGNKINLSELFLKEINFLKIEIKKTEPEITTLEFFPYEPMCCIDGNCARCCVGDECSEDTATFPLVFLHGHSVTRDLPLEYSLEGFKNLQDRLEEDGYLNAGAVTLYTKKNVPAGIWNFNFPISIRGSYYFDFFEEPENYKVVLTKSENIDTYAVRLKEVFDNIRFRTGKDKVNVIAFSMGGLVVRRHMQLFGSDGFDKVILIGTPNKGISGEVSTFCPLIGGEKRECEDMNADSLFMQKLNRDKVPANIYNIYGTGCDMDGNAGDGIVSEESARLDIAQNFIINGTCRGKLQPLHLDLLKINLYPEVYEIINEILK